MYIYRLKNNYVFNLLNKYLLSINNKFEWLKVDMQIIYFTDKQITDIEEEYLEIGPHISMEINKKVLEVIKRGEFYEIYPLDLLIIENSCYEMGQIIEITGEV